MQYYQEGKKSKRFSLGSDFTEQIFTREFSGVDSARVLRQGVISVPWNPTLDMLWSVKYTFTCYR